MSRISRQQVNIQQSRLASRDAGTRARADKTASDTSKPSFEQSMQKASSAQTSNPTGTTRKQTNNKGHTQPQTGKPTSTTTTSQPVARQQTTTNTRFGSENLTREQSADSFPAVASSVLDMLRHEKTETPDSDSQNTFESSIPDLDWDSAISMLIEQMQAYQSPAFEDTDSPRSFTLFAGNEHEFELHLTWQTDGQVHMMLGDNPQRSRQSHKQLIEHLRRQFEHSDHLMANDFNIVIGGDRRFQ